jgi:hypothetical protein
MTGFLRRLLFSSDALDALIEVARSQSELIDLQNATIASLRSDLLSLDLAHIRNLRGVVEHFLIASESGIDVRDDLLDGLRDLSDHIARLEEHHAPY